MQHRRAVGFLCRGSVLAVWLSLAAPAAQAFTVNAADYGYNTEDATNALQAAINSGADTVVVPNMGSDWIVRPLFLASNQTLHFDAGVVITAKPGAFHGNNDCLFTGNNLSHVRLEGYGATLRMQKQDYANSALYAWSEWRHVLYLLSCSQVEILGLTLRDSGGDGLFAGSFLGKPPCTDVHVQDVVCDNNYRQGISVTNAENVLIENTVMKNTSGTEPQSGIDLEPDGDSHRLVNCVIRNCRIENNAKAGVIVYPQMLADTSPDISITFSNCTITSAGGWGIQVSPLWENGADGFVRFEDCLIEDVKGPGLYVAGKHAYKAGVEFIRCRWRRVAKASINGFPAIPLVLTGDFPDLAPEYGGIRFTDSVVEDELNRVALTTLEPVASQGCANLRGSLYVENPYGARVNLGSKAHDIDLQVLSGTPATVPTRTPTPTVTFTFTPTLTPPPGATPTPAGTLAPTPMPSGTVVATPSVQATTVPEEQSMVYPNPSHGPVVFRITPRSPAEAVAIKLFNIAGRLVFQHSTQLAFGTTQVACDLKLPAGLYLYRIERPGKAEQGKIYIQN